MDKILLKIKLIYLPYVVVGIAFIAGYTFLNWLLIIKLELLALNDDVVNYWLPFSLVWIPILLVLRPRLKLLRLKTKKSDLPMLYYFAIAASICIPTIIAQQYIPLATGKLTTLQSIAGIDHTPLTKFYKLRRHYIDKTRIGVHYRSETSGKNNETLTFYIDVVCPVLDTAQAKAAPVLSGEPLKQLMSSVDPKTALITVDGVTIDNSLLSKINPNDILDVSIVKPVDYSPIYGARAKNGVIIITTKGAQHGQVFNDRTAPKAWLGIEFKERISNNLNDGEKESAYKAFAQETEKAFKDTDLENFTYLDRIGASTKHRGLLKAVSKISASGKPPVILEAVNQPFETRTGDKLGWIFKSYGIGAAIFLIMICIPKIDENAYELYLNPPLGKQFSFAGLLQSLTKSNLYVTAIIAAINVLMFIIMVFAGLGFISFPGDELMNWGANYRPAVLDGQWWRLLTGTFLHGGLMHLAGNLYGLFFAALFLEPKIGKLRYAITYVICGIAASLVSIWWHPASVGVGASGAIFGLYGVSIVLLLTNRADLKANRGLLILNMVFIGYNLLLGIFGNADNAAHIGGLAAGLVLGCVLYFYLPKPKPKRKYVRKKKVVADAEEELKPEE
jgi:rhomboid protease GluP